MLKKILLLFFLFSSIFTEECNDGTTCAGSSICCPHASGYGCCPYPNGICCGIGKCCPSGYTCTDGECLKQNSYESMKFLEFP